MSKPRAYMRKQTPPKELLRYSADKFCLILERIDNRCMAADGCVTRTLQEATDSELRMLYKLADKIRELSRRQS